MIIFFSELINYLSLSLIYSSIPAGRTTVALLHHSGSNTILHSPHTSTRQHKLADMPNILPSSSSCGTLLFLCATASPCPVPISLSFHPSAFLGHWAPPIFIHTMPCLFSCWLGGGWSHRWRDDFMLQQQQKREEKATTSLRAYLSLNWTHTRAFVRTHKPDCVIQ